MSDFSLRLLSSNEIREIDGLTSFVGEDDSGSFGLLADHTRMITSLVFGLARFRIADQPWQYLALPGALLYFNDNRLQICTRHFLIDSDYARISRLLQERLLSEENSLSSIKRSLHRMEEQVMRHLWELGRRAPGEE